MSEQHEVTVYDRVPATAQISVEQVQRYFERTGWTRAEVRGRAAWTLRDAEDDLFIYAHDGVRGLRVYVEALAAHEARRPSAILADIAKEQA